MGDRLGRTVVKNLKNFSFLSTFFYLSFSVIIRLNSSISELGVKYIVGLKLKISPQLCKELRASLGQICLFFSFRSHRSIFSQLIL